MNAKKIIDILICKIYYKVMLCVDDIHQNILYTVIMLIFSIIMVDKTMKNAHSKKCIMDGNLKMQIVISLGHVQNSPLSCLSCNNLFMKGG